MEGCLINKRAYSQKEWAFVFLVLARCALGKFSGVRLDKMSFSCFYISNSLPAVGRRIWQAPEELKGEGG